MDTQGITTHKFVAVLNKKIEVGKLMNALGHMSAGLSNLYQNKSEMRFDSYIDKDGGNHKSISDLEQQERTKQTPEAELEYWGVCMFGEKEKLNELTRKFSLWK